MKWILTISIVVFFHGIFAQDIKVFEDSLISLLKNVQTEKNAQQAKHHNLILLNKQVRFSDLA